MDGFSCSRVGWPLSKAFQQSIFFEFILFLLYVGMQNICPCEEWEARLHVWSFLWPPVVSGGSGCETSKKHVKNSPKTFQNLCQTLQNSGLERDFGCNFGALGGSQHKLLFLAMQKHQKPVKTCIKSS